MHHALENLLTLSSKVWSFCNWALQLLSGLNSYQCGLLVYRRFMHLTPKASICLSPHSHFSYFKLSWLSPLLLSSQFDGPEIVIPGAIFLCNLLLTAIIFNVYILYGGRQSFWSSSSNLLSQSWHKLECHLSITLSCRNRNVCLQTHVKCKEK